jgi:pimeloyl-ACP methyl ester carboxylesterase
VAREFVEIGAARIEYELLLPRQPRAAAATLVFLHEGLGSISMWRDFPQALVDAAGAPGLVYSRPGYGGSSRVPGARHPQYMHEEALRVLPALLDHLQIAAPVLFGHSDGGSIALIHAGGSGRAVSGVIALAPHVMVEPESIAGISAAREAWLNADLRARLARHHDDPDGTFWGWNDIWLSPEFRAWNIEQYLPHIACAVLAIQGLEDQYGTLEQIRRIGRGVPRVQMLELEHCGHSPHRDQPAAVLSASTAFIGSLSNSVASSSSNGPGRPSSKPCP